MVAKKFTPDLTSQDWMSWRLTLDAAHVNAERMALAFLPQAQDTPNMSVRVLAGPLFTNGALTEIAAQNTSTIAAPVGNPRIDRVALNPATGAVELVTGTPAASPAIPALPSGRWPICRFQLATSTTAITNSMIVDERAMPTGTAALYDVGTGANQIPRNSDISAATATVTAGEALAIRDAIYQDMFNERGGGADRWYKIDTDATGPVRIGPRVGIALAAISSGASGSAQVRAGRVAGFSGLTAGQPVYASTTAGALTQTAPAIPASGAQNASRLIGYAASATEIDFDPEDDTVFTARNSAVAVDGTVTVQHWSDTGAREREQAAYLVQAAGGEQPVSQSAGTPIGNMTDGGGLAALFDGALNTAWGVGASVGAVPATAGKDWGAGVTKKISRFRVRTPTDSSSLRGGSSETLKLQGSTDNFASSIVDLYSGATGTPGVSTWIDVTSGITTTTAYRYHRIHISANTAFNGFAAELEFFELAPARDEPLTIGGSIANSAATDRVNVRYDDGAGANADTRTTFVNRTGATRDLAVEVVL